MNSLIQERRWVVNPGGATFPKLLFAAGMHGNERMGVNALNQFAAENNSILDGVVQGFLGNLKAIKQAVRYIDEDLNRLWPIDNSLLPEFPDSLEGKEAVQIYEGLKTVLGTQNPLKFIDLHTTSAPSVPFIITDDRKPCLDFAKQFPVPVVIGLPQYIEGTLLQWLNNLGYVGMAFEAGQHEELASKRRHRALLELTLHYEEIKPIKERTLNLLLQELSAPLDLQDVFRMAYRHKAKGKFRMKPGYKNFQPVVKGEVIANENEKPVMCPMDGYMFMPLYQTSGNDGFFIVEKVG